MDNLKILKIGTRKSELALYQTNLVQRALEEKFPAEIIPMVTRGDRDARPFLQIQGDGFFTKEIEHSLLRKETDLAVHSCKDLASLQHRDLSWVAFGERESTKDILITRKENVISEDPLVLKNNIAIGSSSPRRKSQLSLLYPTCRVEELRGNVPTRVQRLIEGKYDAIILAEAGVNRLSLKEWILDNGLVYYQLPCQTAPGQGILAVQGYKESKEALQYLGNNDLTEIALLEKEILALLGGGCHLACGAEVTKTDNWNLNFYLKDEQNDYQFSLSEKTKGQLLRKLASKLINCKPPTTSKPFKKVILVQSLQNILETAKVFSQNNIECIPWILRDIKPSWKIEEVQNIFNSKDFDCIVFSSQFAIKILLQDLAYLNPSLIEVLKNTSILSVGSKTQEVLKGYGFDSKTPEKAHAKSLAEELKGLTPLVIGSPDSQLLIELKNKGKNYKFLEVYRSFPSVSALKELPPISPGDSVVLTSPSLARDFHEIYSKNDSKNNSQNAKSFENVQIYSFGPTTGKTLQELGIKYLENPVSGKWDSLINLIK